MKAKYPLILLLLLSMSVGCNQNKEQLEALQRENEELRAANEASQQEVIELKTTMDDQVTEINTLRGQVDAYKAKASTPNQPVAPKYDPKYAALISGLHAGWEELVGGGSRSKLMSYFIDGYSVNGVRFTGEAGASVGQGMGNFEQYLDEIAKMDDLDVSFGQVNLLFAEQVGSNYTVTYTTAIRVFMGGKETEVRDIVCVVSGREDDGLKVGNYSWVSLSHRAG